MRELKDRVFVRVCVCACVCLRLQAFDSSGEAAAAAAAAAAASFQNSLGDNKLFLKRISVTKQDVFQRFRIC